MKRTAKPRTCKNKACADKFVPTRPLQNACSIGCAIIIGRDKIRADAAKVAKLERQNDKVRREALKDIPELKAEAQEATNDLVRYRDRNKTCICCGGMPKTSGALTGGAWDACHYRSRGSADHLRYNLDNIHRGLKDCNKYGHTDYRGGLIARIGIARVEALECDQTVVKWTADMLREIRDSRRAQLRALKANEFMEAA
jgi:hypothetical protein